MSLESFDRNIRFFGHEGQEKLRRAHVAVVGVGGTGTHVVQQLAYLGVGELSLIDDGHLKVTSRNRYVGSQRGDVAARPLKVRIAARYAQLASDDISVHEFPVSVISQSGFEGVIHSDYVFGCVDDDGVRLVLTELCSAYSKPMFDVASDIEEVEGKLRYGGRVCTAIGGDACPLCLGQIDLTEASLALGDVAVREQKNRMYGVGYEDLSKAGPSVISLNGVVASLAVTEFMLHVTGIRHAKRLLTYRGDLGKVLVSVDEPYQNCFFCKGLWGRGRSAGIEEKYLQKAQAL